MGEEKEPLLEGALFNAELAGAGHSGARARSGPDLTSLDMLVELDEPEQLMRELKRIADERPKTDKRWVGVSRLCERYAEYTEVINRPEANRPHGSVLGGNHGKVGAE